MHYFTILCCYIISCTGKTMSPRVMFHNAASNIICQVLFATRYEYDHALIQFIVRCFTENTRITNGPWAMVSKSTLVYNNDSCFMCHNLCGVCRVSKGTKIQNEDAENTNKRQNVPEMQNHSFEFSISCS